MVELRPIIIGTIFTLASYIILSTAQQGGINGLIVYLLGGVLVGFIIASKKDITSNIKNLLVNGVIFGLITGIISLIILVIELIILGGGYEIDGTIIIPLLILLVSDLIIAIAGVIIGNFTREEFLNHLAVEK
jgi:hypothetical protein